MRRLLLGMRSMEPFGRQERGWPASSGSGRVVLLAVMLLLAFLPALHAHPLDLSSPSTVGADLKCALCTNSSAEPASSDGVAACVDIPRRLASSAPSSYPDAGFRSPLLTRGPPAA